MENIIGLIFKTNCLNNCELYARWVILLSYFILCEENDRPFCSSTLCSRYYFNPNLFRKYWEWILDQKLLFLCSRIQRFQINPKPKSNLVLVLQLAYYLSGSFIAQFSTGLLSSHFNSITQISSPLCSTLANLLILLKTYFRNII